MAGVVLEVLGALKKITEPLYLYLCGHFSLVFCLFVICFNSELAFKIIEYIIIVCIYATVCTWRSENILRLFLFTVDSGD